MTGMVQGGWEYVIIVYVATWLTLGSYFVSLILRGRGK
ncbi:MAG: CcmD family protein [Alphaproteobacteria bacterium]|nr:CcmD family protein [Alphaproteobacteria bacterium]